MTFDQFKTAIEKLEKVRERTHDLHRHGLGLLDYNEAYETIISTLLQSLFNSEGIGWIEWYLYERKSPTGSILTASDGEGNQICHNVESLWDTVKEHKL
jgi:hypothetical protein